MRESILGRGIAAVICGVWLCAVVSNPVGAAFEDKVEVIKLVGGELRILNFYDVDERPKVQINGREFIFGSGSTTLYKKFRLFDREVVIFDTNLGGSGTPSTYDILTVEFNGKIHEYDMIYPHVSPWDGVFIIKQKGDTLYFDLGYHEGLKVDAVLSAKELKISKRSVTRPVYDRKDCKWLYEQALEDCVARHSGTRVCTDLDLSMAAVRGLATLEEHPRWKTGGPRFEKLCAAACEGKKSPSYATFAKDVCGP